LTEDPIDIEKDYVLTPSVSNMADPVKETKRLSGSNNSQNDSPVKRSSSNNGMNKGVLSTKNGQALGRQNTIEEVDKDAIQIRKINFDISNVRSKVSPRKAKVSLKGVRGK
jgi:hypothetical protein